MRNRTTRPPAARRVARLVAPALLAGGILAPALAPADPAVAASAPASFVPVAPCRLLDTRVRPGRLLASEGEIDVTVAGRCGVGRDAAAVAVTVTAVRPIAAGYLIAYPTGSSRPLASTVNYRAGQVVANAQLTQLGDGGRITIHALAASHVVVDVTGYFVPAPGGSDAGRYVPLAARRLVDTRSSARPAPSDAVRVELPAAVPADAVAVAVNVTTTLTVGPDVFTARPAGADLPLASMLNVDGRGQTRSASAIVPVADRAFEVVTHHGNHVIVDLLGYITGDSAPVSTEGLFVATVPTRLVDTRADAGPAGGPRLWDGGTREFRTSHITGSGVAAVAANLTMARTEDIGYLAAYPAGTRRPGTSAVNTDRAANTVANLAIVQTSTRGIAVSSLDATHLVVDITGWFTGTPVAAGPERAVNQPPGPRRVVIISDSTMAGIRWNGALGGLQGFTPVTRLESCRRLVQASCRGREGYAPRTVVNELLAMGPVGKEDILVIGAGYDDWYGRFSADFDVVVNTARSLGYRHIAWASYRTQVAYAQPGGGLPNYAAMNAILAAKAASGLYPDVRIWDFDTYAASSVGWFYSDGIHETRLGSWGVADWISRHVLAFDDKPCLHPWRAGEAADNPCPNPDPLPPSRGMPDIAAIYGL